MTNQPSLNFKLLYAETTVATIVNILPSSLWEDYWVLRGTLALLAYPIGHLSRLYVAFS